MKRYLEVFSLLLVCGLFIAGCGGGGSSGTSAATSGDSSAKPWVGSWQMTKLDGVSPVSGYSGKFDFNSGGTFTFVIIFTTIGLDCTREGSYTVNANLEYMMTITSIKGCDQVQDKHTEENGKLTFSNGDKAMTMEQTDDVTTQWARIS